MPRKPKGRPIDGVLLVDKPQGLTSNATLQAAKRAFYAAKAGHTGSLDPLATGVLPLCFGEGTKFSRFLLEADKTYLSTFVLGVATTTGDAEGEPISSVDASAITVERLEHALEKFVGEIQQIPPMYSAIKQGGKPLYQLAREGIVVERDARTVTIHEFEIRSFSPGNQASLDVLVRCSKGTYIRSLAEDLGESLGCGGHVSALRRIQSGPFSIDDCVTLEHVESLAESRNFDELNSLLRPVSSVLVDLPEIRISEDSAFYLRQGQAVRIANLPESGLIRMSLDSGEFIGVGEPTDDGRLTPRRLIVSTQQHL